MYVQSSPLRHLSKVPESIIEVLDCGDICGGFKNQWIKESLPPLAPEAWGDTDIVCLVKYAV